MAYTPTVYTNDASSPDLDSTNLNKSEQGIKQAHDIAEQAHDIAEQAHDIAEQAHDFADGASATPEAGKAMVWGELEFSTRPIVSLVSLGSKYTTKLNVNSGYKQNTGWFCVFCGNTASGNATYSVLYHLRCGYDGNIINATEISVSGSAPSRPTFSVNASGFLEITNTNSFSVSIKFL